MALGTAWKQMSWLYYQYLLITALYMLEPWERTIFSILVKCVCVCHFKNFVI
ncbi:serine palmitoyltransferase small subunit A [Rhincodon typus]|uniref:serine palmitoyltransferase small subunit A n=1 Tax=Rhincodon typus TaxID=259920 RepID=UPI0020304DB5|nr:serine palmitoyltransferase small subunit A [Rhincodon typus]